MIRDFGAIVFCILMAYLVAISASVDGAIFSGLPVILLCAIVSFATHWIIAVPSLFTSSEKYFDFTGMVATLLLVLTSMFALLSSGAEASIRSVFVATFVSVWTLRLGIFLYKRIVKAGEDRRFRDIKKSLPKFLMTWTLSALWVFLTTVNAITLIALNPHEPIGVFFVFGALLWLLGFGFEVIADRQKSTSVSSLKIKAVLSLRAFGLSLVTQTILEKLFCGQGLQLSRYHFYPAGSL